MRSRLAMSMAAAMVVAAPVITIASASASVSAQPVRGQAITAAPAVSKPDKPGKPDKPHGNKHCGYPTNRPNVYLGPSSQTIDRGQRAAAVGWAGCNGQELEGVPVDLRVSGQADGFCSDTGGQGVFRCSTTQLEHNAVASATVAGSRSNNIKIRVDR